MNLNYPSINYLRNCFRISEVPSNRWLLGLTDSGREIGKQGSSLVSIYDQITHKGQSNSCLNGNWNILRLQYYSIVDVLRQTTKYSILIVYIIRVHKFRSTMRYDGSSNYNDIQSRFEFRCVGILAYLTNLTYLFPRGLNLPTPYLLFWYTLINLNMLTKRLRVTPQ